MKERVPKSFRATKITKTRPKSNTRSLKTGNTTRIRRVDPYTEEWNSLRKKVHQKYGWACAKCSSTKKLEVHHIIRVSRGGRNTMSNLILLCHVCHKKQPGHQHLH